MTTKNINELFPEELQRISDVLLENEDNAQETRDNVKREFSAACSALESATAETAIAHKEARRSAFLFLVGNLSNTFFQVFETLKQKLSKKEELKQKCQLTEEKLQYTEEQLETAKLQQEAFNSFLATL